MLLLDGFIILALFIFKYLVMQAFPLHPQQSIIIYILIFIHTEIWQVFKRHVLEIKK